MTDTIPALSTWIGNEEELAAEQEAEFLHDPNTGERLQQSRASSADQVERALALAWEVHEAQTWQRIGLEGRARHLLRLADLIDAQQGRIAELDSLNSGVTLRESSLFAGSLGDTIRSSVGLATERGDTQQLPASQGSVTIRRVPWGPTALIAPWNAPSAVAVKKLVYALVAGAPAILKPSSASPWSSEVIAAAVAEAGIPAGVFSLVLGGAAVGSQLCSDPRIRAISMTGSTATGRHIAADSAANLTRLRLELGSNNPALVLADADVEDAADRLTSGITKLNGQWCEAPRRILVSDTVHDDFLATLTKRLQGARVGSSFDADTVVGPMAFRQRAEDLDAQRRHLTERGGRAHFADGDHGEGWFFAPTVVDGSDIELPGEIFGPMVAVEAYSSLDSAVRSANQGSHGLAGYVFGRDEAHALEVGSRLEAGEVKINGTSLLDMAEGSAQSFFGDSGLGGHGELDVLDFYSGKQIVGVDLKTAVI